MNVKEKQMKKEINIALIDDEASTLSILESIIRTLFIEKEQLVEVKAFYNPQDLINSCKSTYYEFIFLDIGLGDYDGIMIAKELVALQIKSKLVFVSSFSDRVFDSLQVHPYGFVRKDNLLNDLKKLINSYLQSNQERQKPDRKLIIEGKDTYCIDIKDIMYIESDGKHQLIHINNGENLQVRKNMEMFEQELNSNDFIRTHKCYLVNAKYIKSIHSDEIILVNNEKLIISKRKVQEIKSQYLKYLQKENSVIISNGI